MRCRTGRGQVPDHAEDRPGEGAALGLAGAMGIDVARLAGVSRKTVSNVVNRYPHVSRDLLRRVEAAIAQLGYTPNHAARSLRTGRTRTIQLVVPELDVPYFAELARLVVRDA